MILSGTKLRDLLASPRRRRRFTMMLMLFAWPAVIALGAALNYLTGSHAPMACLPVLWLIALACMMERRLAAYDSRSR